MVLAVYKFEIAGGITTSLTGALDMATPFLVKTVDVSLGIPTASSIAESSSLSRKPSSFLSTSLGLSA